MSDESVVKQLEQVGTIKLSEAIREGAKLRPQGFGGVLGQVELGTSCALHAAYEAINGRAPAHSCALSWWAIKTFGHKITYDIIDKNDEQKWSREQCADYAESLGY